MNDKLRKFKSQKNEKEKRKKNDWETEWKMPVEPRLKILENICQCCTAKESQICTYHTIHHIHGWRGVYSMDGDKIAADTYVRTYKKKCKRGGVSWNTELSNAAAV